MRRGQLVFLLVVGLFPLAVAEDRIAFPPPPRLATTALELEELKKSPEFPALRDARIRDADTLLAKPCVIPDKEAQWIFYYACPDDGTALSPSKPPEEHQCPKCKKVLSDERTVAAYRCTLHYAAETAALTLGEAYAYTGEEKYAVEVKRILVRLADLYGTYPGRHDRWGHSGWFAPLGGRRYAQSLDEAVGAVKLTKAYDLTRDAKAWSDTDRAHVEKDFFRATADTLLRFNQDINNHQTWYNAGLISIASVLGDEEMVGKVLTMRGGFRDQLKRSVTSDGLWYEGTMAYHNYALQAMIGIVDAGRRMGLPLHEEPGVRAMIEAPLRFAYPNGQFPAINDSDPASMANFDDSFQWAWKTWRDPLFARAWARGDAEKLRKLGVEGKPPNVGTVNLAGAGLVRMQRGADAEAACVFVDYGPHGAGHGHPDKLNVMLYAIGREWLLDPGRLDYSHKEYKSWCRQTVAHNTVVLDGGSQNPTTGKCLWLRDQPEYAACCVESDGAYPGSMLRRCLVLTPHMMVDVFDVESSKSHTMDWVAHATSESVMPPGEMPAGTEASPGKSNGYEHLSDSKSWKEAGASTWEFKAKDGKILRLWLAASVPETIFTAKGIGYYVNELVPCLLRRREGKGTRFVSVWDWSGDGRFIQSMAEKDGRVEIVTKEGTWKLSLAKEDRDTSIEMK